jgi:hypothetical protein
MSEPLRVALVAEGPTDKTVIAAAIESVLGASPFILKQLQPEESLPFNQLRGGWGGVYHWCIQAIGRAGGVLSDDPLFVTFDVLVLHLDADVAGNSYADAGIVDPANDLPCEQPCPPSQNTTDRLRAVILRWLGAIDPPPKTVLCTPSKSIEAWVLAALYPADPIVASGNLECHATPDLRLQAKPIDGRLVTGGKKRPAVYQRRAQEIATAWPQVRTSCAEAQRFSDDFQALLRPPQAVG